MIKYIQIFFELTFIIELLEYYEDFCLKKKYHLFFIPKTRKRQYLYELMFSDIKKILINKKIIYIHKNFESVKISDCYFHYVKILLGKR